MQQSEIFACVQNIFIYFGLRFLSIHVHMFNITYTLQINISANNSAERNGKADTTETMLSPWILPPYSRENANTAHTHIHIQLCQFSLCRKYDSIHRNGRSTHQALLILMRCAAEITVFFWSSQINKHPKRAASTRA